MEFYYIIVSSMLSLFFLILMIGLTAVIIRYLVGEEQ